MKEANKYVEQLRDKVRAHNNSHKFIKKEHAALKIEHARIEKRLDKLEDENEVKDTYFSWMS